MSDYVEIPDLNINDIYVLLFIVIFIIMVVAALHYTRKWLMRANALSDGKLPRSRTELRFDVRIPVQLNAGSFDASLEATILDVSKGGLKLITKRAGFIRSSKYTLHCEHEAWTILNNLNIKLLVAHKGPDKNDVVMHCRWKGLSRSDKEQIFHHLVSKSKRLSRD